MTGDTTGGSGRNLRPALMASLALNVLIVGAVAAALLLPHLHGGRRHHPPPAGLAGFAETLPADRGEFVRQKVEGERATFETIRKEQREAREAARTALIEEPFDVAKFKAALDRAAQADDKETRARMALVADTAAQLTPEERKQLHAYFEKHRARKRHSHAPEEPKPSE
jgi:uncharacterized membrane protein